MKLAPIADRDRVVAALARDPNLTLLLDLDGTLIPFADRPEEATLDGAAIDLLGRLHEAGIQVVIISGRPQALLEPLRLMAPRAWWAAEHGTWTYEEATGWRGPAPARDIPGLAAALARCSRFPGVRVERKSLSLCVHWRTTPFELKENVIAQVELLCDEWLELQPDFERIAGVEMLEVRRRSANKGVAVGWVRARRPGARFLAIGDDETDEDMFAALCDGEIAISVGPRTSARAAGRLADPVAVRELLAWLVEMRTGTPTNPVPRFELTSPPRPVRARLVVVSNRIPPPPRRRDGQVGGLVSALEPALATSDGVWLGWSGHEAEGTRPVTVDRATAPLRASFDFAPGWRESYYGGFCNRALWPLFHGFPGRVQYSDAAWLAYVAANSEFARHADELVTADGTVWVHDYHLMLVARALRARGFSGPIGLFLHVPFPGRDLFDTLPWADEIMAALLSFDLVGFHTERWAQNFRDSASGRLGTRRLPEIGVLPIGVDPLSLAATSNVSLEITRLQAALGNRRMILGVDRLDYAKGIPERLLAFERLLDTVPAWRGMVSFVQISVPSREDIPEYAELRHRVETLVGRINGRFGEADYVPVRYLYRSYDREVLAQLYRAADVALVTPLRDGLNLIAKEFVVAQDPRSPGVLVLSRFAGAAVELPDAVLTNPFHPDGLASDLDRALRMPSGERMRRHALMMAALADQTPQRWAAAFLERLLGAERAVA